MTKKTIIYLSLVLVFIVGIVYYFYVKENLQSQPTAPTYSTSPNQAPSNTTSSFSQVIYNIADLYSGEVKFLKFTNPATGDVVTFKLLNDKTHQAQNPTFDIFVNNKLAGEFGGDSVSTPMFSSDNKYFAFRAVGSCGVNCYGTNISVVDIPNLKTSTINPPQAEKDFSGEKSHLGYVLNPIIESFSWNIGDKLNINFFFLGAAYDDASGTTNYYRVSPKEIWSYDLTDKTYALTQTLPENK